MALLAAIVLVSVPIAMLLELNCPAASLLVVNALLPMAIFWLPRAAAESPMARELSPSPIINEPAPS